MRRLLGAAVLSALLLTGCGDASDNPGPSDPVSTAPADAVATTGTDADLATSTPDIATATGTPSATSADPTDAAGTPTDSVPGTSPAPSAAPSAGTPGTRPVSGCTGDELSQDILGFPGGVHVYFCDGDWAYASYPEAPGEPEFIAQRVDGRWFHAVAMGDPVCREDLAARGAPPAIAKLLPGCEELPPAPPTTAPPTTAPPAPDCVINTNLYGDTHVELIGVSCVEATAEWELAEANAEPSWTIPWITPTGWECYVTPYDPDSKAAGACYGPEGHAYFTLYAP